MSGSIDPRVPWLTEYAENFVSAKSHAFILSGDVEGVAYENRSQRGMLLRTLALSHQVVAVYHVSVDGGIDLFDGDREITIKGENGKEVTLTRRKRAMMLAGFEKPAAQQPATQAGAGAGAAGILAGLRSQQQAGQGESDPFREANRPTDALAILGTLLRAGTRSCAVVLDYADALVPAPAMAGKGAMSPDDRRILISLLSWAKDTTISDNENAVFLVAANAGDLHTDLLAAGSGWTSIPIALPTRDERAEYLTWYLARRAELGVPVALLDGLEVPEVANLTAGLNLRNLEDVLLLARQRDGLSRGLLKAHKDGIIGAAYAGVAEMIEPLRAGFAGLGGAAFVKDFIRRRVIEPIREGRLQDVPKSILLVGPPGTGKTYLLRALSKETGFSVVGLNASKILGGIVGESEKNLARFLSFATALAPVIIFIDEIDQSDMAQRGNNSGNPVAKNLFSALMQFMSDETLRGKVLVAMATNRPDLLDSALTRDGRMDAVIPMLLPDEADREMIALAQATDQRVRLTDAALALIASSATEGYSAAGIASVVREARLAREDVTSDLIGEIAVRSVLADITPSGVADAPYYTELALAAVRDKRLLPPAYRQRAELAASEQVQQRAAAALTPQGESRERRERAL